MKRLSGIDSMFLSLETPTQHLHVSLIAVLDTSDMPGGYSFEAVRDLIAERVALIPLFRRRAVEVPFRLHHPVWIEDPAFDLDYHLRRVAVPAPGGMAELCELAGDFLGRPLSRDRPLWEFQVVEGLADGRVGVLAKVHHSAVDGVSGAEIIVNLFDLERDPPPRQAPAEPPEADHVPSDAELTLDALRSLATDPVRVARVLPRTVRSFRAMVRQRREREGPGMGMPFSGPRLPWNSALTPHRAVAVARLRLEDVKRIKNAAGVTVNDVVLALCAGALRRYLDKIGETPDAPLVAAVPISVRGQVPDDGSNNQVSGMLVSLATDLDDPLDRLHAIAAAARGAKEDHRALGPDLVQSWAQLVAPGVLARTFRMYSSMRLADRHPPALNVTVSNVPGPPFPLYLAGAQVEMLCPLGPVMDGAGLNITVLSYCDAIDVGLLACKELVPDLDGLADAFDAAGAELLAAATA